MGLIFRGTDDTIKADDGSLTIEGRAGQFPSGIEVGTAATIKTNGNATFSGIVTATSFVGSGADLTGIDATSIKDSSGNVKAQGNVGGIVVTGVVTSTGGFSGDGSGLTGVASTDNIQTATDATFLANVSIGGSLTVDGDSTFINASTLRVEDKNIELGLLDDSTEGNDSAIDDGGIILRSSDGSKDFTWKQSTASWTSNQDIDINDDTKGYKIAGTTILSKTALASSIRFNLINASI